MNGSDRDAAILQNLPLDGHLVSTCAPDNLPVDVDPPSDPLGQSERPLESRTDSWPVKGGLTPQALFESIVVNANDVVLVTEAEPVDLPSGGPRVIYVNPAFTRMTGYEPEDILGRTPRILQSPQTDRTELDRLRKALLSWEAVEVELLNLRKDGTEFWVQISITPVINAVGWYTHWVAIQRDITARKRRELAVRTMLESTSDLMMVLSDRHDVTLVTPACHDILGISPESLQGSGFLPLVHPADRPVLMQLLEPSMVPRFGRQAAVELRMRHSGGHWRWLDVHVADFPYTTDAPGAPSVVLACSDITEHKATKDALADINSRFRSAFDDAPIGMAITTMTGQFLQVNSALSELLGYSTEKLLGMTVHDVTHPDDTQHAERQRLTLLRGDHSRRQHETRFLHADGSVVGILHSASTVRNSDDVPVLLIDHIEDITERQVFESRLQHYALHDTLTALPNRALFMDRLHQALQPGTRQAQDQSTVDGGPLFAVDSVTTRALPPTAGSGDTAQPTVRVDRQRSAGVGAGENRAGSGLQTAVLFCDIDRFKAINDTYGHHVGDLVLTAVAHRLHNVIQDKDTVARFGGDELVILCPNMTADAATTISSRLLDAVRKPVTVNGHDITVTLSIGIALAAPGTTSPDQLLRASDDAMYAAKEAGRGQYALHDSRQGVVVRRRAKLEAELPRAITNNEFTLHYQPQIALDGQHVVGLEALVRWEHPDLGLLMPDAFIDIAENSNLMRTLGRWVLQAALSEAARLRAENSDAPVMWVNVSASELEDPGFAACIEQALRNHDLPGSALGLEITESVLMNNLKRTHLTLIRIRSLGVSLAIDDFGTGYSSLSYIAQFPVTTIKVDASFTAGLDDPDRRRESFAIVTAVIGLAHSLHLTVIAEGIETPTQALILHGLGCDQGQGYLVGRPVPSQAAAH